MTTTLPSLSGPHLRTYEKILRHPSPPTLAWRDVHALLEHIGQAEREANGNLKVTLHAQTQVFHSARASETVGMDELIALRHFLATPEPSGSGVVDEMPPLRSLVVIDHREASVYRSERPGAQPRQIKPHQPDEYFRHAHHSRDFARGQEKPDPNSFFAPIAVALKDVDQILLMGPGKGSASEMEQLAGWLAHHHPELSRRIVGSIVVDEHHLTEAQMLAKARDFYAHVPSRL